MSSGIEIRAVQVNLLPLTERKKSTLDEMEMLVKDAMRFMLGKLKAEHPETFNKLHELSYRGLRARYPLQCQTLIEAMHRVWENRGRANEIKHVCIDFNVPRSGKLAETKRHNPILAVATNLHRIGLPIKQDRAYQRLKDIRKDGYVFTQFRLTRRDGKWVAIMNLRREVALQEPANAKAVVGVDVGTACLASISIVNRQGRVLRQLYFGRKVSAKQRNIGVRRSNLQSKVDFGSFKARRALKKLRGFERNYNKTNSYQIAHAIVNLAKEYNATIAAENLRGLNQSSLRCKTNRKVKRTPYYVFRIALESVAHRNGVEVTAINPKHTSQECPRCHAISRRNRRSSNHATFKCVSCGYTCNADRNASRNIAMRLATMLWERRKDMLIRAVPSQSSQSETAVGQSIRPDARLNQPLQGFDSSPKGKPIVFRYG